MALPMERLAAIAAHYDELEAQMAEPDLIKDQEKYIAVMKEYHELQPLVLNMRRIKEIEIEVEENKILLTENEDQDFRDLARSEINKLEDERERLTAELIDLMAPKDPNDEKNVIIEIRGGAGGDEAALFAADLYGMYTSSAENNGWTHEIVDLNETEIGGFKEVVFMIKGKGAYSHYKFESGVHRVQRVPTTEAGGRIHTSTVTVAVLPEAEEVEIEINPSDLQIDAFRASGAGGQHVNKTSSAIRILHVPSGLVVTSQDQRSQHQNREQAMRVLRAKLYQMEQEKKSEAIASERRSQVGTGDRSERIRTYNFPQGRVTDHRINLTLYNLDQILAGEIEPLVTALQAAAREAQMASEGN
ncbi:MAG: peptide chain release factor 1 [Eubacteriales bacterium]|nr:peptide chain release factor 1 [Eubacteriales bacterium]